MRDLNSVFSSLLSLSLSCEAHKQHYLRHPPPPSTSRQILSVSLLLWCGVVWFQCCSALLRFFSVHFTSSLLLRYSWLSTTTSPNPLFSTTELSSAPLKKRTGTAERNHLLQHTRHSLLPNRQIAVKKRRANS